MRRVAILIPGSRTSAFFSQIAAISAALRALPWRRWQPSVHAYLGGPGGSDENGEWERFAPYLRDVHITDVSAEAFRLKGNWTQVDATLSWRHLTRTFSCHWTPTPCRWRASRTCSIA